MEVRQLTDHEYENKWNNLLNSLSQSESEFLVNVRRVQLDNSIQNKINRIQPLFNEEMVSILSAFFKKPPLSELIILKDRMEILKKIIMAGFFTAGNESVIKTVSKQIEDEYIKALENQLDALQLVVNDSKSKLNEKDKVIGWLQTVLLRSESNQQSQLETSLVGNPSSMWQQPSAKPSQDETSSIVLRCDVRK